jgi:prepilin-type N-terminal cleavage/methylation domain-containing protein
VKTICDFEFRISDLGARRRAPRAAGFIPAVSTVPARVPAIAPHSFTEASFMQSQPAKSGAKCRPRAPAGINPAARHGFTLVEMLVAVGLIVLMMTLFASIFQMATGALAQQKGLSENDQRVRLVETLLRNDLNGNKADQNNNNQPRSYRTFRILIPYAQNETVPPIDPVSHVPVDPGDRLGYFAISENNPNDDTDDVLSLTVALPLASPERFYGKAAVVLPDTNGNYGPTNANPGAGYPGGYPANPAQPGGPYWLNQPEFDDYLGAINQAGNSIVAEVSYFLRHGTLYRRLLLIRSPNVTPPPEDGQPTDSIGGVLPLAWYTGAGNPPFLRNFWGDFDYSAFNDPANPAAPLRFHFNLPGAIDSLSIGSQNLGNANPQVLPYVLGNPAYRFGHDDTLGTVLPTFGQPREFDSQGNFIGRFTQRETSDARFGYPGIVNATYPNPMSMNSNVLYNSATETLTLPIGGLGANGYRAGEDALMANVLKFDIKVWDPKASYGPDGLPGIAGFDDDANGTVDDLTELGASGSDDGAFVDIGHGGRYGCYNAASSANLNYSPGQVGSMPVLFTGGNNVAPWTNAAWPNGAPVYINRFDTWNPYLDLNGDVIGDLPPFGPIPQTSNTGVSLQTAKNNSANWPGYFPIGNGPDGRPGRAGFDDDGRNGVDDPGEIGTPGTDDFLALSAIQIKITFYDTTSKQLREMTFVQSLLDTQ